MVRRDAYFERFREMTTERGWTEQQQIFIGSIAVTGFGSTEQLEHLLRETFLIEDTLAAERGEAIIQYENVFNRSGVLRQQQAEGGAI